MVSAINFASNNQPLAYNMNATGGICADRIDVHAGRKADCLHKTFELQVEVS